MNCPESRLLLHAYADNELDMANSLAVESHLRTCSGCAAELQSVRALKTVLHGAPLRFEAPSRFKKRIRRDVREADHASFRSRFQSLLLWRSLAFGATTFAVAVLILRPPAISDQKLFLDEAIGSHVRSLMVEHLTDVTSSDQHTVKPWFDGKLDFAPQVKDFSAEGFPLLGGRLDYLNDHPVAALIYKRNKHIINVFVEPGDEPRHGRSPATARYRGYNVVASKNAEFRYTMVSDLNTAELTELAGLITR